MTGKVIIVGATAAIGKAIVREFARNGFGVVCCARDRGDVQKVAMDAAIRYQVPVAWYVFDAMALATHENLLRTIAKEQDNVCGMVIVQGYLDAQDSLAISVDGLRKTVDVNYSSIVTLTTAFVRAYQRKGNFIAVIGSVAGERGKKRNFVYSSMKGAVSVYLDGLRQAVPEMVVVDIRPGFIDTPMTYGNIPRVAFFVAARETVARDVFSGIMKRKRVIYTPFWYRYVMFILRNLPWGVYTRLRL